MSLPSRSKRSNARLGVYFAAACALTIGLAVGVFGLFRKHQSEVGPESQNQDAEGLSEQMRSLNREVALLRARQATTEEKVRSPETFGLQDSADELLRDPSTALDREGDREPPAEVTPEEAKAQAAARYEFLDSSFESEPRDAAWSATTESAIADAFGSEELRGAELDFASCGSTMCKVEMSLASEAEVGGFQEVFARTIRDSLPRGTMRQIETDDGGLKLVAYLARPDSRLPQWKPEDGP